MTINGKTFDFNGTKLGNLKKLQDGIAACAEKVLEGSKKMEAGLFYDGAVIQIDAFRQFFIDVVGEDVVGDCDDLALASAYFEDFQKKIVEQRDKVKKEYFRR